MKQHFEKNIQIITNYHENYIYIGVRNGNTIFNIFNILLPLFKTFDFIDLGEPLTYFSIKGILLFSFPSSML